MVTLALAATALAQVSPLYPYSTPRPFSVHPYAVPHQEVVIAPTVVPVVQPYIANPHIPILRQDQDVREDGTYQYGYVCYQFNNSLNQQTVSGIIKLEFF